MTAIITQFTCNYAINKFVTKAKMTKNDKVQYFPQIT